MKHVPSRRGRAARQEARLHAATERIPFITRTLKPMEVLSEEGLSTIEENADTILEQVGIDFRDWPDAIKRMKDASMTILTVNAVGFVVITLATIGNIPAVVCDFFSAPLIRGVFIHLKLHGSSP